VQKRKVIWIQITQINFISDYSIWTADL